MHHNKLIKGFTLIELMIYILLVAGVVLAATTFAWNIINSRTKSFAVEEVQQNGRFIITKITQAIRGATDISAPTTGTIGSDLQLIYKDPLRDPVHYALTGSTLTLSEGSGPPIELHSSSVVVSNVEFSNFSTPDGRSKNVRVVVTLKHANPENRQEWEYEDIFMTTVELRDR